MQPDFTLLYVADPTASARFYAGLLGRAPVEASPGFALFAFDSGARLGLWRRDTVAPPADAAPGAAELGFAVAGDDAVDATHAAWTSQGIAIAQPPTAMEFGRTFTALDPDGHRLRVFARHERALGCRGPALRFGLMAVTEADLRANGAATGSAWG